LILILNLDKGQNVKIISTVQHNILKLIVNYIPGGKKSEWSRSEQLGKVERVWDVYPYPRKTEVNIVLADLSAIPMATATPERNNPNFYTDQDVPILWYATQCTVADQGKVLLDVIIPHAYGEMNKRTLRIIWIPKSGVVGQQEFDRDVMEVADSIQKAKIFAENHGVQVEIALGKSWLPLGMAWHGDALNIARMNNALDVLSFFWLHCRSIDFTVLTMHEMERAEKTPVKIQGLEKFYLVPGEYNLPKEGGHTLGWFAGRKGREIIRKILVKYELEPAWEKVERSMLKFYAIPHPRIYYNGIMRRVPEPQKGKLQPCDTFKERRKERREYLAGRSETYKLTDTHLASYPWKHLNIQSTVVNYPRHEMLTDRLLDPKNRILDTEMKGEMSPEVMEQEIRVETSPEEREQEKTPRSRTVAREYLYDERYRNRIPKRGRFMAIRNPSVIVTRIFSGKTSSTGSALDRLGPRVTRDRSVSSQRHREADKRSRQSRSRQDYSRREQGGRRLSRSETSRGQREGRRSNRSSRDGKPQNSKGRRAECSYYEETLRPADADNQSESDYGEEPQPTKAKSQQPEVITLGEDNEQETQANRSADSDEVEMVLDDWDVPPTYNPSDTSSTTSSDEEEDEKLMQVLVDKVAAKVRADFKKAKEEKKKKKQQEKVDKKKAK